MSILLLSNRSKIFEKVIHCSLNLFLEPNNCLLLSYHAQVMPTSNWILINYSSNNTLMTIVESIEKQLDAGNYTAGVFNDLKRLLTRWITTFYLRNFIIYYGIKGVAKN